MQLIMGIPSLSSVTTQKGSLRNTRVARSGGACATQGLANIVRHIVGCRLTRVARIQMPVGGRWRGRKSAWQTLLMP